MTNGIQEEVLPKQTLLQEESESEWEVQSGSTELSSESEESSDEDSGDEVPDGKRRSIRPVP